MTASDPESQIAAWLAKYAPAIEAQLKDARLRLRAYLTRGHELVFDNYNALVFGISPTERTSGAFISVAGYPKWITLFFLHGTALTDPHGLLEGQGKLPRVVLVPVLAFHRRNTGLLLGLAALSVVLADTSCAANFHWGG